MQSTNQFIIHGIHIKENLAHHKLSDVRRILDEKGFRETAEPADTESTHFQPPAGTPDSQLITTIRFDDAGFVAEDGVSHSDAG